jgi:hypothetical protein
MNQRALCAAFAMTGALTGCASPFAQSTGIDWNGRPAPGTITVSDPKEYRREALINERIGEIAWLDQLLEQSKTIEFKPEIAREVEQIVSISAALGLSFDPASAINYRRANETGAIQQQIDVVDMRLKLDKLKRDAELVRAQFADQTAPSNANVGTLSDAGSTSVPASQAAAAAEQLKAAIDRLNSGLTNRLDADGKSAALASTTTNANPADTFRDRVSYRDMLKTARNAASLDELHDTNGAALTRLNFHTAILPDREAARVPGVIQVRINRMPGTTAEELKFEQGVYRGWINYLNSVINVENGDRWDSNPDMLQPSVAQSVDLVEFRYAPPALAAPAKAPAAAQKKGGAKAKAKAPVAAPPPPTCPGLILSAAAAPSPGCASLFFAVPKFKGSSLQEGAFSDIFKYVEVFKLDNAAFSEAAEIVDFQAVRATIASYHPDLVTGCGLPHAAQAGASDAAAVDKSYIRLGEARLRIVGGGQLLEVNRLARTLLASKGINAPDDPHLEPIVRRIKRSEELLSNLEAFAYNGCTRDQRQAYRDAVGQVFVPPGFSDMLSNPGQVSIYEVGPRNLVQQVSTVARAANNLSLALQVAGSAPGSGVAANAAGSYSRQAMGRAAMLERVPAIVGYSLRAQQTFGWVIGPLATIDPKGKIEMDQSLREYDLTVDLSVPSWWPSFQVETTTAWAPRPEAISEGSLAPGTPGSATGQGRKAATVYRRLNDADYAVMTGQLANRGVAVPKRATIAVAALRGQAVNACLATTLNVSGENLWRANVALINGYKLGPTAISVAPDMGGVLIDVPALDSALGDVADAQLRLTLLTPYGEPSVMVDFVHKKGDCKPAVKAADGPSISTVIPLVIRAPGEVTFQLTGEKLDQVTSVTLNGQLGTLAPAGKGGKTLSVKFLTAATESLPASRTVPLALFKGGDKATEKTIEVTRNSEGK